MEESFVVLAVAAAASKIVIIDLTERVSIIMQLYANLYIYKEGELVGHGGVPTNYSAVCGPIWLKLWWMVR